MAWADLCNGGTITGHRVTPGTLASDHAKRQPLLADAMPSAALITEMIAEAQDLDLPSAPKPRRKGDKGKKTKGIAFHLARCNINENRIQISETYSEFVGQKTGASVCYEDTILPRDFAPGHILVHQGVAPCLRCRAGYSAWAVERRCTIVVDADQEYDQSGNNPTFLFLPSGLVLYDS